MAARRPPRREWFDAAQLQLQKNKEDARRNRKYEYLLASRFHCVCSRRMTGNWRFSGTKKYFYYRCQDILYTHGMGQCRERAIRVDKLDQAIWDRLKKELSDEVLIEGVRARRQRAELELEPKRERLKSIDEEIERETMRIRKLMRTFSDCEDDTLSAEYDATVKEAARHKNALLARKRELEEEMEQATLSPEDETATIETVRTLRRKIEGGSNPTFAQKRHLLELLDVQVQLLREGSNRSAEVNYNINAREAIVLKLGSC